jgi:hypothetical protein
MPRKVLGTRFAPNKWLQQLIATRRNIKGAPFGVGFECSAQPLQKGTPFYD